MKTSFLFHAIGMPLLAAGLLAMPAAAHAAGSEPWYERLWSAIVSPFHHTKENATAAADAVRDASGAIVDASRIRLIQDQSKCVPNDEKTGICQITAESICQKKGFSTGKPADTVSYEACAGIASNLSNGARCKVKYRLTAAACW